MIGFLKGRLLRCRPERVLLEVGGVGYEVHVPLTTYYEIERQGDGPVGLFIHTHVREEALALYGFWTEREKDLFEKLIGVSGIGPRLAQVILSGMAGEELLGALAAGDLARLTRIPGVGKRTAERLVLELRDKARELAAAAPSESAGALDDELVAALTNLGYKPAEAARAVAAVGRERPAAPLPERLRLALQRLSRA